MPKTHLAPGWFLLGNRCAMHCEKIVMSQETKLWPHDTELLNNTFLGRPLNDSKNVTKSWLTLLYLMKLRHFYSSYFQNYLSRNFHPFSQSVYAEMTTTLTPIPFSLCISVSLMMPDDYSTFALLGVICHAPSLLLPTCISGRCSAFSTSPDAKLAFVELLLWVLQIFRHYTNGGAVMTGGVAAGDPREKWREGSAMHSSSSSSSPSSAIDWCCLANFMTLSHLSRIMLMNQLFVRACVCVCVCQDISTRVPLCVCVCGWRP